MFDCIISHLDIIDSFNLLRTCKRNYQRMITDIEEMLRIINLDNPYHFKILILKSRAVYIFTSKCIKLMCKFNIGNAISGLCWEQDRYELLMTASEYGTINLYNTVLPKCREKSYILIYKKHLINFLKNEISLKDFNILRKQDIFSEIDGEEINTMICEYGSFEIISDLAFISQSNFNKIVSRGNLNYIIHFEKFINEIDWYEAYINSCMSGNYECFRYIIDKCLLIGYPLSFDINVYTAVIDGGNLEMFKSLEELGGYHYENYEYLLERTDIDKKNGDIYFYIFYKINYDRIDIMDFYNVCELGLLSYAKDLIKIYVNSSIGYETWSQIYEYSFLLGNIDLVKSIREYIDSSDLYFIIPSSQMFVYTIISGSLELFKYIFDDNEMSPYILNEVFNIACKKGAIEIVKYILQTRDFENNKYAILISTMISKNCPETTILDVMQNVDDPGIMLVMGYYEKKYQLNRSK